MKKLRRSKNVSLEELYARSRIPLGTLRGLENGTQRPVIPLIYPLARGLNCSLSELFTDDLRQEWIKELSGIQSKIEEYKETFTKEQKSELEELVKSMNALLLATEEDLTVEDVKEQLLNIDPTAPVRNKRRG